jgi:two-component system chemotaxis sensor kinase CheA
MVIQHVFDSGFSTLDRVNDISGRGIGMDAIRTCALELGGQCRVVSKVGKGSTLVIEFPEREPVFEPGHSK